MGRDLTDRERDLLAFMIEYGEPVPDDAPVSVEDRRRWQAQLPGARAGSGCGCGTCPSITVEDEHGRAPVGGRRVVLSTGHPDATLLLFVDGDRLSYLELAPHGDEPFPEFPPVTDILR
jgi:hypothetical protein